MRRENSRIGIIIGATGFIGMHISKHLANNGTDLILVGRNQQKLSQLKTEILKTSGINVETIELDSNDIDLDKFKLELNKYPGKICFCINTIGMQLPLGDFINTNFDEWYENIETNLRLNARILHLFATYFVKNESGSIIIFSGGGASHLRSQFSAYATAKTALVRLVEVVAEEVLPFGVQVNAVAPGVMPSKMQLEILDNQSFLSNVEILNAKKSLSNLTYEPKKVIELVNFLISEKSKGITGKLISAEWDNWKIWPEYLDEIADSDLYTLRRVTGKDRNFILGDI